MPLERRQGLRVSACLMEDVSTSIKKLNIQKCEIPLEPAWEQQPHGQDSWPGAWHHRQTKVGFSQPGSLTFTGTYICLPRFSQKEKKKCFIASSTKKEGSFHLQKSHRPWKTTKELKATGFPSHLRHHQEVLPLLTCLHLLPTVVFSFLCFSFLPSDVSFLLQEEILPAPWAGRAPTHPRGKGRTSTTITTSLPPATSATALSIYKTQHLSSSLMHPVLIIPFGLCS